MIYLACLLAVGWLGDRLYLAQRIADWRTETLAAEADLRAAQPPNRRAMRHPSTVADTWRLTAVAAAHQRPERHMVRSRPAVSRLVLPEIARLCCPLFDPPAEDRWMIRRRTHEQVAA